jgi:hypothetical protein
VPHSCAFFLAQGWETSTLLEIRINNPKPAPFHFFA